MLDARIALIGAALALLACEAKREESAPAPRPKPPEPLQPLDRLPTPAPSQPGLAVAIVVDTSGSMRSWLEGDSESKAALAHEAIASSIAAIEGYAKKHPELPIAVGIFAFSDVAELVAPITPFTASGLLRALGKLPSPYGETAIGDAILLAARHLVRSGLRRKHIIVITDGANSMGVKPSAALDILVEQGAGTIAHFVAFDTGAERFAYVTERGGALLSARDGPELSAALEDVLATRILVEAPE
jgi:Mg-chelatase subunit ChlD